MQHPFCWDSRYEVYSTLNPRRANTNLHQSPNNNILYQETCTSTCSTCKKLAHKIAHTPPNTHKITPSPEHTKITKIFTSWYNNAINNLFYLVSIITSRGINFKNPPVLWRFTIVSTIAKVFFTLVLSSLRVSRFLWAKEKIKS